MKRLQNYLEAVPNAVAMTCPILAMYRHGSFLVARMNSTLSVPKPWRNKPSRTVMKYRPSRPTKSANESISIIFAVTKKNTPNGDNLKSRTARVNISSPKCCYFYKPSKSFDLNTKRILRERISKTQVVLSLVGGFKRKD
jgi:hypothetical protein